MRNKSLLIKTWLLRVFLIIYTLLLLYPLIWNVFSSFKTNTEFLTNQVSLPKGFEWDNYVRAFVRANMGDYFFNSVLVVVLATCFLVIFVVPTSYALARFRFFGSRFIEALFMTCIFIQAAYIMVPLYVQMFRLGMVDNLFALSFVYAILGFPFSIFLLCGYMRSIPSSYAEAARIDGCTNWGILLRVMVPLAKPGIATVTMLSAMGTWNEYPLALVLIRTAERRTLPVGLAHLYQVQRRATDFGALFAALVIVLIPTIIIYLVGQKYLLKGVGAGGLKE
jgi:N-acetylglucosamine transport system permease protein